MSLRSAALVSLLALAPLGALAGTDAQPVATETAKKTERTVYYRYDTGPGKSGDFELLTREFRNEKTGKTVTLTGMIHIADPAYYAKVEKLADKHDVVLLEGVKGGASIVTVLPLIYQMHLGPRLMFPARLDGQQDYFRGEGGNRINADVDMNEISEGTGIGGFVTLPLVVAFGETAYILEGAGEQFALLGGTRAVTRMSREMLADALSEANKEPGDTDFDRIIIDKRNTALLEVLDKELKKPAVKSALIPWGAQHNTGLEEALLKRGFKSVADTWNTAFTVKRTDTSPETDTGARYRFPYLLSFAFTDTLSDFHGPLSLVSAHKSPLRETNTLAWGLLHYDSTEDGDLVATDLLGLLRLRRENTDHKSKDLSCLLGLYNTVSSPEKESVGLGWWGFLGGATDVKKAGEPISSEWHLPLTFGKYPLIYGEKTDSASGETEHRFLLFFKATSGK